jgi:TIR domain-containing protein
MLVLYPARRVVAGARFVMADIFISYSKKDKPLAEQLGGLLEELGFSVWWDAELIPAEEFREEIRRQIQAAQAAIVIWSENSAKSAFVIDEADLAREEGKLISTLADGFAPNRVPLGFRNAHMTSLSDGDALMRALASRGLAASKPVSGFLLSLFHDRVASIRKTRNWAFPVALLLTAVAAAAGMVYALQLGKEVRSPVENMRAMYSFTRGEEPRILAGKILSPARDTSIGQRFDGLWAIYIRKVQTHIVTSSLKVVQKEDRSTVLYARDYWEPVIKINPGAEEAIKGLGYISTCVHFSVSAEGPISTIGIVRKFGAPAIVNNEIQSVDFEPAEASVVAALSKEHLCNYRL